MKLTKFDEVENFGDFKSTYRDESSHDGTQLAWETCQDVASDGPSFEVNY